jgi:UDP-N-acetylglucosamine 2-epimerase (non-hydrolysing)
MLTILNVVGTRPNLVKMAPLIRAMRQCGGIHPLLVHTGQHYDDLLSGIFFRDLEMDPPDFELNIGSFEREEQLARISAAFEPVLLKVKPDLVLVVGDVNSSLACARTANAHGVPVLHVEAGLRSFDTTMPEELNRIETDHLADYLFVTERSGIVNLQREQTAGRAIFVGNVMIDSLKGQIDRGGVPRLMTSLNLEESAYVVVTIHRPSNVDERPALERVLGLIESIAAKVRIVFPLHPRTGAMLNKYGLMQRLSAVANVTVTAPLGYADFIALVKGSLAVITDSGGVQEETTYLRVPCITMRENTERPSTIDVGTNLLVGSDRELLMAALTAALDGTFKVGRVPELWDGHAAERIVDHLLQSHVKHLHVA